MAALHQLRGGFIEIHENESGSCSVTMLTYFETRRRLAAHLRWPIQQVIKYMHRFVMHDLEQQVRELAVEKGAWVAQEG